MTLSLEQYVQSSRALATHPAIKWANQELPIKDITMDVQRRLNAERNHIKPLFIKAAFYITAAMATALLAGAIFQVGLIVVGSMSAQHPAHYLVFISLPFVCHFAWSLYCSNSLNEIVAREKVIADVSNTEKQSQVKNWLEERQKRSEEIYKLGAAVYKSNSSLWTMINAAEQKANETSAMIRNLTPIQRTVVTGFAE